MQSAGNSASTWKNINKVLGTSNSNSVITELTINGCIICGSNLYNPFDAYLVKLAFSETTLDATTLSSTSSISNDATTAMKTLIINREGVFQLLLQLDAKKGSGADNLPTEFLKR